MIPKIFKRGFARPKKRLQSSYGGETGRSGARHPARRVRSQQDGLLDRVGRVHHFVDSHSLEVAGVPAEVAPGTPHERVLVVITAGAYNDPQIRRTVTEIFRQIVATVQS